MNYGGPAFPWKEQTKGGFIDHPGMSLRDWFAGKALQGMVSGSQGLEISIREFAKSSYELADEMIAEREKKA